jgi:hypothetical protein
MMMLLFLHKYDRDWKNVTDGSETASPYIFVDIRSEGYCQQGRILGIGLNQPRRRANSGQLVQEVIHLFEPPGPVVVDIVAPDVDPGGYRFGQQITSS